MTSPSPSVDPVRERIAEIQQRVNAATDGPWRWEDVRTDEVVERPGGESQRFGVSLRTVQTYPTMSVGPLCKFILAEVSYEQDTGDDAVFIAAARSDVPALLAALTAVLDLHRYGPEMLGVSSARCRYCHKPWPCETVSAIAAGLGVTP